MGNPGRSRFFSSFSAALLLSVLNPPVGLAELPADSERRGIYVSAQVVGGPEFADLADSLMAVGGNTIVFDIKDQPGELNYLSTVPLALEIGASHKATMVDPMGLVRILQERGIYTVARISCFYDEHLAKSRPDLVPHARGGQGLWRERGHLAWVDPSLPEVQWYVLDLVSEAAGFGVDEIQLDYVRFPTGGKVEEAVFAVDGLNVSKREVITAFVRQVRRTLIGTGVRLSADIFGIVAWRRDVDLDRTGQDLMSILPYLDVVSPMLYPSHFFPGFDDVVNPVEHPYYFVHQGCKRILQIATNHGVQVRPWLQAFPYRIPNLDRTYITEQIAAAEDAGTNGWLLWHPSGDYKLALTAIGDYRHGPRRNLVDDERMPVRFNQRASPNDATSDSVAD